MDWLGGTGDGECIVGYTPWKGRDLRVGKSVLIGLLGCRGGSYEFLEGVETGKGRYVGCGWGYGWYLWGNVIVVVERDVGGVGEVETEGHGA